MALSIFSHQCPFPFCQKLGKNGCPPYYIDGWYWYFDVWGGGGVQPHLFPFPSKKFPWAMMDKISVQFLIFDEITSRWPGKKLFSGYLDVISSKMKNFGGLPPKKCWTVASPALAFSIKLQISYNIDASKPVCACTCTGALCLSIAHVQFLFHEVIRWTIIAD